ncbi:MAG: hypothetical protein ABIQ31_02985, partial [Ferruginibacter sp.]
MAESLTIDRDNKLPQAQDYYFLRKEGIKSIEELSGKKWTDYNTHDPGITLLEVLCYALTDLGYRTSFEIADIITPLNKSDTWKKIFYAAHEILPCNPVTLVDYRKLIIDTEGVRNAWIEISDEYDPVVYLQRTQKSSKQIYNLSYDYTNAEVLRLRGLYRVFIEYEDDVDMVEVSKIIEQKLRAHRNLTEDFLPVTSVEYEEFTIDAIIQVSEGVLIEDINARIYKLIYDFFSPPINFYSLEQMIEKNLSAEEIFDGPILNYGFIDTAELDKSERSKNFHLSDIIKLISGIEGVIAVKKFEFISDSQVKYNVTKFTEWIDNVKDNQKTPKLISAKSNVTFQRSGDRNRSEIEKLVEKDLVEKKYKFLKADNLKRRLRGSVRTMPLPLGEFMDIGDYYPFQKNLPSVYGMTEAFINKNDWSERASVEEAERELLYSKAGVNGTKLVQLLLKYQRDREKIPLKPGEERREFVSISKLVDELIAGPENNVLLVLGIIDKVFIDKSTDKMLKRIIYELFPEKKDQPVTKEVLYDYVNDNPRYIAPSQKTLMLQQLALEKMGKLLHQLTNAGDITRLGELYKKNQVDLLDKSKKSVLQLRGFLMVFEQIIADYLSQLGHIREIFSFDENIKQTFFPQVIDEIQDMEALFIDFEAYRDSHLKMIENRDNFVSRRNNILDHLLGRFSESMDKYAFFMQQFAGKEAGEKLITDKIEFLSDYIQISNYRGNGYDHRDPHNNWNSDNVEGLKKRICRLLGIKSRELDKKSKNYGLKNYNRKKIAPSALTITPTKLEKGVDRHVVTLADPDDMETILMSSKPEDYKFKSEAAIISTYILERGYDSSLYEKHGQGDKWTFEFKRMTPENKNETVAVSNIFLSGNDRDKALERTIKVLKDFSEDENFHIVEHILLRPRSDEGERGSYPLTEFLPAEAVPDNVKPEEIQKKDFPYKFDEKQKKLENTIFWKLSLMKTNSDFLTVPDDFTFYKHLTRRKEHIRKFGSDRWNYITEQTIDGQYTFKIKDGERVLAESKKKYNRAEDFEAEITALVSFFSYELDFVTAPKDGDEDGPTFYADPYSFHVSFIFPCWQRRFRDKTFKHLLEKTIYLETPS